MEGEAQARFADVQALVDQHDLAFPLVAIDGQLRLAGSAHYFQIVPLVAQALEQQTATLVTE